MTNNIPIPAYLVRMTTGNTHQIDADELPKLMAAVASGSACILRQCIIVNPNTIADIVADLERINQIRETNRMNKHAIENEGRAPEVMKPLLDYFHQARAALGEQKKLK